MNIQGAQSQSPSLAAQSASTPQSASGPSAAAGPQVHAQSIVTAIEALTTVAAELKAAGSAMHDATRARAAIERALGRGASSATADALAEAGRTFSAKSDSAASHAGNVERVRAEIAQATTEVEGVDRRLAQISYAGARAVQSTLRASDDPADPTASDEDLRAEERIQALSRQATLATTRVIQLTPAAICGHGLPADAEVGLPAFTTALAGNLSRCNDLVRLDRMYASYTATTARNAERFQIHESQIQIDVSLATIGRMLALGEREVLLSGDNRSRYDHFVSSTHQSHAAFINASAAVGLDVSRDGIAADVTPSDLTPVQLESRADRVAYTVRATRIPEEALGPLTTAATTPGACLSSALLDAFVSHCRRLVRHVARIDGIPPLIPTLATRLLETLDAQRTHRQGEQGPWGRRIGLLFASGGPLAGPASASHASVERCARAVADRDLRRSDLLQKQLLRNLSRSFEQGVAVKESAAAAQARIETLSKKLTDVRSKHETALGERRRAAEALRAAEAIDALARQSDGELNVQLRRAKGIETRTRNRYESMVAIQQDPARSALRGLMTDFALRRVLGEHLDVDESEMLEKVEAKGANAQYFDTETLLAAVAEVARSMLLGPGTVQPVVDAPFAHSDAIGYGFRKRNAGPPRECDANTSRVSIQVPAAGAPMISHLYPSLAGQTS